MLAGWVDGAGEVDGAIVWVYGIWIYVIERSRLEIEVYVVDGR
jgi:hypothetical protein